MSWVIRSGTPNRRVATRTSRVSLLMPMICSWATYPMYARPKNGSTWCSHSAKNGIGPSTTWASSQLVPPWHSVGKAVSSFGSPS